MSYPGDENPKWRKREPPTWSPQPPPPPLSYEEMYGHPPYERPEQQPPIWQEQAPRPQFQALPPTNGLAIAALILAISSFVALPLVGSIAGVVCGHIARGQIRRSREPVRGDGLALAGLVVGWVGIVFYVLLIGLIAVGIGLSL
jgi:hypothetical protein